MRISIYTLFLTGSSPRFYLLKNSHSLFIKCNKIYFIGIFINLSIKSLIGSFQIKLFFINKSIPIIENNHRRAFHRVKPATFQAFCRRLCGEYRHPYRTFRVSIRHIPSSCRQTRRLRRQLRRQEYGSKLCLKTSGHGL